MKTILTLIIVGAVSLNSQASTDAMLRGIRVVETQDQLHPPRGKLGERGPYQFRRATWRMHTSSSFDLAENREVANTVAKRHYAWIEAQLKANGVEVSPYNIAMAWNAGVNAVIRGHVPSVARDYANRVLNVAETYGTDAPTEPATSTTVMVAEETPASQPEATATQVVAVSTESPVEASVTTNDAATNVVSANAVPTEYVYTVPPSDDDPVPVRFHTSPIMLAFNRYNPPESAKDTETVPAQIAVLANAPIGADLLQTSGRM